MRNFRVLAAAASLVLGIAGAAFGASADPNWPGVTADDVGLLRLNYRTMVFNAGDKAPAGLADVQTRINSRGGRGGAGARGAAAGSAAAAPAGPTGQAAQFHLMAEGMSLIQYGEWNDERKIAAAMDMRIPAKLYAPGETVEVTVGPAYDPGVAPKDPMTVRLSVVTPDKNFVGASKTLEFKTLAEQKASFELPADLKDGRYQVRYVIYGQDGDNPLLAAPRFFVVVNKLADRLAALEKAKTALHANEAAPEFVAKKSYAHELAMNTVDWYADIYKQAKSEFLPTPYNAHPMFMMAQFPEYRLETELVDWVPELAQAEKWAAALQKGDDPVKGTTGVFRLVYKSPVDQALVPFGVFFPEGAAKEKYPFVTALHGYSGTELSFMRAYDKTFTKEAQARGYIAATPSGRGPFAGYGGNGGKDVLDVITVMRKLYPIDEKKIYLTGHSMGGGGTVTVGFQNPEQFAAMASIAGFGAPAVYTRAGQNIPDMPYLFAAGDKDALVAIATAKAAYEAAKAGGMKELKFFEDADADHMTIPAKAMKDVFDWFDGHVKK